MSEVSGFFNIDKPTGMTSHDVVAKIRRGLKLKKVGHAGTLDPMATGVLIICVGSATRLSEYVMHANKQYRARVHLGVTTDTYDAEGEIQQTCDAGGIQREDVQNALKPFIGDIHQEPPMYSAIKQSGRKLYELARAGQTVERESREVRIESVEITEWSPPEFTLEVVCSAGTYIRSLAFDLGKALGVGAHLSGLTRTASGAFRIEDAVLLDSLLTSENWQAYLTPARVGLKDWPTINFDVGQAEAISHGRSVADKAAVGGHLVLAFNDTNDLIGIVQADSGLWKPHKVFSS